MSAEADAKFLLGNETFSAALDNLRSHAVSKAIACPPEDDEGRKQFLNLARASDHVRGYLTALIVTEDHKKRAAEIAKLDNIYQDQATNRFRLLRGENVDRPLTKVING